MKVLMFGWEFPPHISGGLGTACHGLTNSLSKENIDVLFVVPKLYGGELAERTDFINASHVPIEIDGSVEEYISPSKNRKVKENLFRVVRKNRNTEQIEVESTLTAYTSPSWETKTGVERWSYELDPELEAIGVADHHNRTDFAKVPASKIASYQFSGSYGPDLLEEVKRYAQVGADIANRFEFDVIHAHDWMTYLAGIAAKKVSGKPLVVHVHATEFDRSGDYVNADVHAIEYQGMEEANCVVAVSNWTKEIIAERYHVNRDKIAVVHNGIVKKTQPSKSFSVPPIGSHIVTFLGRITHQKGPLYFVEAARRVLDAIPDAHFVVAGSGDLMPIMIERIAQLRMSSHFHFTGFLKGKDIERVWQMSNVYVMPSVSEPFGIAPLEAIQAGVPVIISKQSGVAEVMPHAMKVDFWNSQELAAAICSVLKYKSLSNTLKKNSGEELGDITWNRAAKKLTQLYYGLTTKQHIA
jgi:glycosyltransferase involved in cell wall biosynthesis